MGRPAKEHVGPCPQGRRWGPFSPVGHVVEVFRELGQVGALFLVLLFGPKQNLGNLKKEADWVEPEAPAFPRCGGFPHPGTSSGGSSGQHPPHLYFIEQLGIQQRQLLGDLMAVEVMQGPGPGRQRHEGKGQRGRTHGGPRTERARRASELNRVAPPWGTGPALLCCLCPWAQPDPTSGPNGNKDGAVPAEAEAPPRRRETAPHGRGRGAGGRLEQTQVLRMFRVAQGWGLGENAQLPCQRQEDARVLTAA